MLKSDIVREIALAAGMEVINVPMAELDETMVLTGIPVQVDQDAWTLADKLAQAGVPTEEQCRDYEKLMVSEAGGFVKGQK